MGRVVHVVRGNEFGDCIPAVEFYFMAFMWFCSLIRHIYLGMAFVFVEYWYIWRMLFYCIVLTILWIDRKPAWRYFCHYFKVLCEVLLVFMVKLRKVWFWVKLVLTILEVLVIALVTFPVGMIKTVKLIVKTMKMLVKTLKMMVKIVKMTVKMLVKTLKMTVMIVKMIVKMLVKTLKMTVMIVKMIVKMLVWTLKMMVKIMVKILVKIYKTSVKIFTFRSRRYSN